MFLTGWSWPACGCNTEIENVTVAMSVQCHRCYFPCSSLHTTCFWGHGTGTIIGLSSCKRHIDVVLGQTWQNSVCYALTSCIKQCSPFSNSMVSASASTPLFHFQFHWIWRGRGYRPSYERRSPLARETLLYEQRRTDHKRVGYPKTITFFNIPYFSGKMPRAFH